eukprot:gene17466-24162_t
MAEAVKGKLFLVGITTFPSRIDDPIWNDIKVAVNPPLTINEMIALKNDLFPPLGFVPSTTIFKLEVDDIPANLIKDEDSSNHASTMFNENTNDITLWFKENLLVMPIPWNLEHPHDIPPNASSTFIDYVDSFRTRGFKVWDIQNKQHANTYIELRSRSTSDSTLISGRADFIITTLSVTTAQYLNELLCVIEHLQKLVGFLVLSNGQCRAFKATRNENSDCVYEQNDMFHLAHIVDMLENILNSN